MTRDSIEIIGAKQNNLKNIDVKIPRDKLTVITGVSGSGKSSLAFDVIYGEGQRRFLESVSNFAKGRINQIKKPDVKFVRGLSPVVSIEQKKGNFNPRSTVGTVTDIQDYLRLLFATAGTGECPVCGHHLNPVKSSQIAEHILSLPEKTVVELLAPAARVKGTDYSFMFDTIRKKGYKKLLINGEVFDLSEKTEIDENTDYSIEIILGRFTLKKSMYIQIAKTIEAAMISLDEDIFIKIEIIKTPSGDSSGAREKFHQKFSCPKHHYILCELQPFHFSFNVDGSACSTCHGIGMSHVVEPRFLIDDPEKSVMQGCFRQSVLPKSSLQSYRGVMHYSAAVKYGYSLDTPFNKLTDEARDVLLYGTKGVPLEMIETPFLKKKNFMVGRCFPWGGVTGDIYWQYHYFVHRITDSGGEPDYIKDVMIETICPDCKGARLKKQRLFVKTGGKTIHELGSMQILQLADFLSKLKFKGHRKEAAESIVHELVKRLQLLLDVGLYYLNLNRRSDSISGGEMQRIKMSTQISSELMGMLYVMDEPSIGLHPRDSVKVIDIMKRLRDIGNTVIVVEHDLETMNNADFLVEIGPGPGIHGGNIIVTGDKKTIIKNPQSITGAYLSGRKKIEVPKKRRFPSDRVITIGGAVENNLKNITVEIPLGLFVCVTGVSGSGKSTLIHDTLFKQMEVVKRQVRIMPGKHEYMLGSEEINNVINIDQSAIGRNSKSNPATYVGIFDAIRKLFADTEEAKCKGYEAIDFSLTHANGTRCEHCSGDGVIVTSLQFMADIETICPVCKGARFSEEGLEIKLKGKSIGDILNMTVEEACVYFKDNKLLNHKLTIMDELGLGYMTLGQSSTTLSGGEAQRVKLSYELAKIKRGSHNLYILDEPTTGLHIADIEKLLISINKLVDSGHTVIVIEHNLDVIKCADYIIDMGPEGGNEGGYIVAAGTPEEIAKTAESYTGKYLADALYA
ncbi:MAG: excinuclease ABC subunit UvrA [Treponema sp.]|nr:excinuclease ABC subunit UvrA [Treponema sp.]